MTQELSFIAWAFSDTEHSRIYPFLRRPKRKKFILDGERTFLISYPSLARSFQVGEIWVQHYSLSQENTTRMIWDMDWKHDGWIIIVLFNFPVLCCVAFGPFFRYSVVFFSVVNKLCGDASYEGISWKKNVQRKII